MKRRYVLEISVESVEAAVAAERGGADRIELCSGLAVGGLTPSAKLMTAACANLQLPIFVMIRPRGGDFIYSEEEFAAMCASIRLAKQMQMHGVVLGVLNPERAIDVRRTKHLVELARGMEVTFHRAFDECADLSRSLEDVIETGVAQLLTSGGKKTAPEALDTLAELVTRAGDRLIVMPGSGIHAGNITALVKGTKAREYHAGLSSVVPRPMENLPRFEESVRQLAAALASSD